MATTAEILSRVATRPTWAEVSLATLRQNFRTVVKHAGAGVTVCAVVKADAYGHGAVECSRALQSEGAKSFVDSWKDLLGSIESKSKALK